MIFDTKMKDYSIFPAVGGRNYVPEWGREIEWVNKCRVVIFNDISFHFLVGFFKSLIYHKVSYAVREMKRENFSEIYLNRDEDNHRYKAV